MSALEEWLDRHDLSALLPLMLENDIDVDVLDELSEDDLKEIGLSLGQRRRLLKALRGATAPPETPTEAVPPGHAERRLVTVLFVDLVGSTAMSTGLDPEDMAAILHRYQDTVSGVVSRAGGYVAKFMGDGVLVYFGWPDVREEEPVLAVRAGIEILEAVSTLNGPDGTALKARIGCDTGWVVIGELIGNQSAQERTIVGDTPNMAARLQGAAQPGAMVIGEATQAQVSHAIEFEALPPAEFRGFSKPVHLARVLGEREVVSRFESRIEGRGMVPLCGRDGEMALIMQRWDLALRGEGQCAILVGEAGIGKSRLLAEVLEKIQAFEHDRLVLQCAPNLADTPFWPLIQAMSRFVFHDKLGNTPPIDALRSYLARVTPRPDTYIPTIATLLSIETDLADDLKTMTPAQRRAEIQTALSGLLIDNASLKPVLIVLEDAHWADPSTLEMFNQFLTDIANAPVFVIITSRPENEPAFIGENQTRLSLSKLSQDAVGDLIAHIALKQAGPLDTVREIVNKTDGIPLFVEEITKSVLEAQTEDADQASPIPASLHDTLMARLDRLSGVQEIAQVAACIGREFDDELLKASIDLPADAVTTALEKLLQAELVYRRNVAGSPRYIFKHALVRDAAWASLTTRRKTAIHKAILDALLATGQSEKALIGYHAAEAGRIDTAYDAFLVAGREAVHSSANQEAIRLLQRALSLADMKEAQDAATARLRAQVILSVPLIAAYGYASEQVDSLLTEALNVDPKVAVPEDVFRLKRALWNCRQDQARLIESLQIADELKTQASDAARGDWLRLAHRARASNLLYMGDILQSEAEFQSCLTVDLPWSRDVTLLEHGEDPEIVSQACLAWIAALDGRMDDARSYLDAAFKTSRALALPIVTALVGCIEAFVFYIDRDVVKAAERTDKFIDFCDEHDFPFWRAAFEIIRGWAGVQNGEGRSALDRAVQGLKDWKTTGAALHICTWNCVLGRAALAFGDLDLARSCVTNGHDSSLSTGDRFLLMDLLLLQADVDHRQGQIDLAVNTLNKCARLAEEQGARRIRMWALENLSEIETDTIASAASKRMAAEIASDLGA